MNSDKWKLKTGDEQLQEEMSRIRSTFDDWFNNYWSKKVSREYMLGDKSPVPHIAYKMTKTFDEIKDLYPHETLLLCVSCYKYVDKCVVSNFECEEYNFEVRLCQDCVEEMSGLFK